MKEIGTMAAFKEVLASAGENKLVVVDFFATWCGPCKVIAPKLAEMEKAFTDVLFCKVDVDECEEVAAEYEINAMPTFKFFKNGKPVDEIVGANEANIKTKIEALK